MGNFPSTFTAVEYHVSDGYATAWGNQRCSFYAVTGTPTAWFDGTLGCVGAYTNDTQQYNWYLAQYNARRAVPTDVTITTTGVPVSGSTFTIRARVALEAGGTGKTMRIYVVQVLDHNPASPTYSRNAFKQAAATEDITLAPGQSQMIQRDFTFDSYSWSRYSDIKIIVWAQCAYANAPAEVFQAAGMGWPFLPDCNGNGLPDAQDIAEGTLLDVNANGVPDQCEAAATVTGQPSDQLVCAGGMASFTVTAAGYPAPTYQWRKGTTNLVTGGNIYGATTATLSVLPAGSNDVATDYNCVVSNVCGADTSSNAALSLNPAPTITAQPTNQAVCSGNPAGFTVSATASPAPTYRWRRGTTDLVDGADFSGAATATLTVNSVSEEDVAADYNCVVTSTCGSTTSDNAALTINAGPVITGHPAGQALVVGGTAMFSVTASSPSGLTYQWRKDAAPLADGGNISNSATAMLTISPVALADAGYYDVVITDACGSATSSLARFLLRGDVNCDGVVNYGDINAFVLALQGPEEYPNRYPECDWYSADIDGSGQVSYADINPFVRLLAGM